LRFWIDECLPPALVDRARALGYDATCTRDRGRLGSTDEELLAAAIDEEFVFVTNNHVDFVRLCAAASLPTGLVILPQRRRTAQIELFDRVIKYIKHRSERAQEDPSDWMLNRVVEVDEGSETPRDAEIHH
jgi:predicted nuclease of predicted toxin-antitoxin system